jgi:hypothetical protein
MLPRNTTDPKHWQGRAAQMRALALTIGDPRVAALMNDLAAHYDKLSETARRSSPWR